MVANGETEMNQLLKQMLLVFMCCLALTGQAIADSLANAVQAYEAGDYAKASKLFRHLAKRGNTIAETDLGLMYSNGQGTPQNLKEAVKWFRMAAERGNADAQNWTGIMYENGQGVPRNYKEAVKWYRLAAEQGIAHAQFKLAGMYEEGEGVKQSYVVALMWANISASNAQKGSSIYREALTNKMTPEQIVEAQELARECTANKFKGCRK